MIPCPSFLSLMQDEIDRKKCVGEGHEGDADGKGETQNNAHNGPKSGAAGDPKDKRIGKGLRSQRLKNHPAQSQEKPASPARMILGSLILSIMSLAGSCGSRVPETRAMNLPKGTSAVPRSREIAPTRTKTTAMTRDRRKTLVGVKGGLWSRSLFIGQ